ncbi:hypothetical protein C8R46DRAFT_1207817 [Mycena filopes]|nr:hypothetical protein C8R46DRAFT_1207817 [Mycena filopes]
MFPTRVRALLSTQFRRQTAVPNSGGGGKFDLKTPAGKNNAIVAAGGVVAVVAATYYMGYWDEAKVKDTAASVKKD